MVSEKIGKVIVLLVIVVVPALIAAIVVAGTVLPLVGEIADASITEAKIAVGAVTAEKIADNAIDFNKLAEEVKNVIAKAAEIPLGSITTEKIADNAITAEKIKRDSITSTEIADATIADADIAENAEIADSKLSQSYLQIAFGLTRGDKIYAGGINFDNNYSKGGEEVDLNMVFQSRIKAVIVEPSKNGYLFEVDSAAFADRTFKIKALHFNPNATIAGPAVEVPEGTDLSIITNLKFIAIGR